MVEVIDKPQTLDPKLKEIVDKEMDDEPGFVRCASCAYVIARMTDIIEVNGSYQHQFSNPYGIQFHLGCYANALGCTISGARTHADTWFPGYQWRLATCTQCDQHLGWYFDRDAEFFYGLILDRIRSD